MALVKALERRCSHRASVELTMDLVLQNNSIVPVTVTNLSEHGLQFRCDDWAAHEIEPRGIHLHPLDHPPLKAVITLQEHSLSIDCRIISARRLSQNNYLIGLEFHPLPEDEHRHLLTYLESL